MKRNKEWLVSALKEPEAMPGVPLVEIVGQRRVLIEKHCGVMAYSSVEICAKVKYGLVCVCGNSLQLAKMTKEQLVIIGQIEQIKLIGGKC